MAIQVSYPGVYIEEFAPGAPIQGVGTSTAALIGIAADGVLNEPTKVTSWDQFKRTFGSEPVPGFYLWYAARGFFENGGNVCYIVRASNGSYGSLDISDRSSVGNNLIHVRARQPGIPATSIEITVEDRHLLTSTNTALYQPTGTLAGPVVGREVTLNATQAWAFRPGDVITIASGGERAQIIRISGDVLSLDHNLNSAYAATNAVRLADAPTGTRTVRITSSVPIPLNGLASGTMLTITQGGTSVTGIVDNVQVEHLNATTDTYRVTFRSGLGAALSMSSAATVQSEEFCVKVTQGNATTYDYLSVDSAHPRYFMSVINGDPGALVVVSRAEPPPPVAAPLNLPEAMSITALNSGTAEDLSSLTDNDFIKALDKLRDIDDVNMVAIPDRITTTVQQAVIAHCEQMMDRIGLLDAGHGLTLFGAGSVETQRASVDSTRGYAALYYPWLRVAPNSSGEPILVPPSGHMCGVFARSDSSRGVHKAPANEIVNGALDVERRMSLIDQGQLNLQGINVIQVFQGGGRPLLWGARTTATDRNWQYVNIRRLFLYLEESIQEGIRWAVFEPNNIALWEKLKRTIRAFLMTQWRDGALFGKTAEEAFYIRIDEVLNPFSEQALGRLNIEIGVRPSYPAEFIVVRIGIWQGGSDVSEA
ncbi:MAG: phage tail sheath subtilisin-like domain-containing protein [Sideroxyarcus sp.]